ERTGMLMAGIDFLWHTRQVGHADDLLQQLRDDKDLAKRPGLWRLGEKVADHPQQNERSPEGPERGLELEYAKLPPVIDLQTVRKEYGKLLGHYEKLADAMVTLKVKPRPEFLAKVVRAADRWRALDAGTSDPSTKAAWILQRLGERE